jgi:hypothetical protein
MGRSGAERGRNVEKDVDWLAHDLLQSQAATGMTRERCKTNASCHFQTIAQWPRLRPLETFL